MAEYSLREVIREALREGLAKSGEIRGTIPAGSTVDFKAIPPKGKNWVCFGDVKGNITLDIFDVTLIKDGKILYSKRIRQADLSTPYKPPYLTKDYCIWRVTNTDTVDRLFEMSIFYAEYPSVIVTQEEAAVKRGA